MDPKLFAMPLFGRRLYGTSTYTTRKQWDCPDSRNFNVFYEAEPQNHYFYVCLFGWETSLLLMRSQ